jgi:RNA methyltransferase, TrmH family
VSEGAFVVEGVKLVTTALEAGAEVEAVFVEHGAAQGSSAVDGALGMARKKGWRVHELGAGVIERVADTVTPQPILAVVRTPSATLEDIARASFVVVCVEVRDPGNLGAIIRSADAAGADAVVCSSGTVDPFNPKTVRASAGSVLHLPVIIGEEPEAVLAGLRERGMRCLAALSHGGTPYTEADLRAPVALVFGNEGAGLPAATGAQIDGTVTIPMAGRAESLNVSTAAAVLCFEVQRARSRAP